MTENLKKVLVNEEGLEITFFVDDGSARVEFRSNGTIDLSEPLDVVLFVNGDSIPVVSASADAATAQIGDWSRYADGPVQLMTRVHEFFDGWELEP